MLLLSMASITLAADFRPPTTVPPAYAEHVQGWTEVPCWKAGDRAEYALTGSDTLPTHFTVEVITETSDGVALRLTHATNDSSLPSPYEAMLANSRILNHPTDATTDGGWREVVWMFTRFSCSRLPLGVATRDDKETITAPAGKVPGWSQIQVLDAPDGSQVGELVMTANDAGLMSITLQSALDPTAWPPRVVYVAKWTLDGKTDGQQLVLTKQAPSPAHKSP